MNKKEIDLKGLVNAYLKQWKWFVLSVFITCLMAFIYLRYTIPQYEAYAKIQILEDKGAASELSILKDLDVFSGGSGAPKIVDEIELLKARENFIKVIKKLKLNVGYFVTGNIRDNEIYGSKYPFAINFLSPDSIINKFEHTFYVKIISATEFNYSEEEEGAFEKYAFGSNIKTKIGDIILVPENQNLPLYKNETIRIEVKPLPLLVEKLRASTKMKVAAEFSNIIDISMMDSKKERAIDILNNLVEINNENAVADKKAIADRTSQFINDRISEIYTNLSSVDETAESFKESRGIADLGSQSNVNFSQSAAGEKQLQETSIQLNIANSMKDLVSDQGNYDYIPTNVGLNDPGIASAAQQYNELVAQRNRLLKSSNEKNPVIVKLDQQLDGLRRGMQSSLNNVTNNLDLQVNSLSKQLSQINSRIYAAPSNERALRDISRKQQTTESLYLYLLQKREESQITFASATPKSKIINYAYSSTFPMTPKNKIVYLAALMLGLLIPFSIIYVNDVLDDKIHNKIDLESIAGDVTVLAELPKLGKKESKVILTEDRSVLAESMRILRTNLDYILKSKTKTMDRAQVVFVTSSVPGEGKTFVSSNLATIFANTGKKVLLIGADIRNPKLYTFFSETLNADGSGIKPKRNVGKGLTEYLFDNSLSEKEIIVGTETNTNDIDVIYSGKIPPNPAELLMSDRMKELFEKMSGLYDYIIVDTAPVMVVTDTLLISQYADQVLYVTKANVTEKKIIEYPLKLKNEGKLKHLSFVVNGVKQSNLGYGGKYGYGYGKTIKKWWSFS
ncbi:GumC family protein [Flagellimonas amoyensis]|uniref:GumC family protein n=1 Tax=Flagellimonas amoyensis TaxID=2169401 RepID=UPI000D37B768|nr:tyrosine-protein kinase family protein [Allomuricauda amoyensis]